MATVLFLVHLILIAGSDSYLFNRIKHERNGIMKKYIYFLMLFGVFFPFFHKTAIVYDNWRLCTTASKLIGIRLYGLDSMRNLLISALAALAAFFFTQLFIRWDSKNKI
ncbi:hypothetical protein KIS4809_0665 [Bacillus sp. ZZV12-4809]|nr:hypothetical protein KIS4809_0665 [Bacillus sp. ZZV12-4809]